MQPYCLMRFVRKWYTPNPSFEASILHRRESNGQQVCTVSRECGQRLRSDLHRGHFHHRNSGYSRALLWAIQHLRKARPIPLKYQQNTFSLPWLGLSKARLHPRHRSFQRHRRYTCSWHLPSPRTVPCNPQYSRSPCSRRPDGSRGKLPGTDHGRALPCRYRGRYSLEHRNR